MPPAQSYRVGWVIPDQVGALTHFTPDIMLDEFQAIAGEASAIFTEANAPFHIIIDNRIMNMAFLPDLDALKRSAPYMNNPYLRQIIMVKPDAMEGRANDLPNISDANITLTYVDTIADAVALLKAADDTLLWHLAEADFFPNATFE